MVREKREPQIRRRRHQARDPKIADQTVPPQPLRSGPDHRHRTEKNHSKQKERRQPMILDESYLGIPFDLEAFAREHPMIPLGEAARNADTLAALKARPARTRRP